MLDAALIVGFLVAGLGGRLLMRVIAATSPDSLHGVRTDADQPIGRVTFGGTFGLIVFGGVLGTLAVAVVYRLVRRWLPVRGWQAGLIAAAIVMALLGDATAVLQPDSKDFEILSPLWLAVAMIALLTIAVGVSYGVIYEHLDHVMPDLAKSRAALAYIPVALFALPGTPAVVVVLVVIGAAFGATLVNALNASVALRRGGHIVLTAVTVGSVGVSAARAIEILG